MLGCALPVRRGVEVVVTPGHAKHEVVYLTVDATAVAGDVCGVALDGHRFLEPRDCKRVGAFEGLRGGDEAVAVGVRLDDRHDAATGGEFPDPREVVPERRRVDHGAQARVQKAPSP